MRFALDSNVLVRALASPRGPAFRLLDPHTLVTSRFSLDEVERALLRRLSVWENEPNRRLMQTTVNPPDSLYEKSEALAASRGATVEQFIVEAVKKEIQDTIGSGASHGNREVELPVIRCRRPGTLDLSNFDFDDLLA